VLRAASRAARHAITSRLSATVPAPLLANATIVLHGFAWQHRRVHNAAAQLPALRIDAQRWLGIYGDAFAADRARAANQRVARNAFNGMRHALHARGTVCLLARHRGMRARVRGARRGMTGMASRRHGGGRIAA